MYKLVALDVDGTLLNDQYEISKVTLETIQKYVHRGVRFLLCTGRAPKSLEHIRELLNNAEPSIVHNGSVVLGAAGEEIWVNDFPVSEVMDVIELCRTDQVHFNSCTIHDIFVEIEGYEEQYRKYMLNPQKIPDMIQLPNRIVKFSIFAEEAVVDRLLAQEFIRNKNLSVVRAGKIFIDFMCKGVSKGAALKKVAKDFGITRNEIMAIGDQFNDIDMLSFAGLGIAMGNAPKEVADRADWVTDTNNKDGVAKALEHFLK